VAPAAEKNEGMVAVMEMPELAWYWWVAIAAGVAGIAYLKLVVGGKMLKAMQEKKAMQERLAEED
jgi:hypothetical protein